MKRTEDTTIEAYKKLASVICETAIHDYIHGTDRDRYEIRQFLLSPTFYILSGGMDGITILTMLDRRLKSGVRS